jgi:hypothetical protein
MDQNNTLGIIQHINHEASLHKEHHISTSHIFELHKQKWGKLEEHQKNTSQTEVRQIRGATFCFMYENIIFSMSYSC